MAVITTRTSVSLVNPEICNVCGEQLRRPWVEWHGRKTFAVCGECCVSLKTGLTADLIHCVAIVELNRQYSGFTLEREAIHTIERRDAAANPDLARMLLGPKRPR
jgi:hypothetical protein